MGSQRIDVARSMTQVVLAPLALMVLFGLVLSWQMQRLPEVRQLVDRANKIISQARQVQRAHYAASAELRGYLLTRGRLFKESYESRRDSLDGEVAELAGLVQGNPQQ